jgi:hypothetical protein
MPVTLCECGCGDPAPIARQTDRRRGVRRGEPLRFIRGHGGRTKVTVRWLVDDATGCWEWQLAKNAAGYGIEGRGLAHRVVWEERNGPVPEGHDLHHVCENKGCVNPDHVEPLTRAAHYRRGGRTVLTLEAVDEIRSAPRDFGSGVALARRHGVHVSAIYAIRDGRNWAEAA